MGYTEHPSNHGICVYFFKHEYLETDHDITLRKLAHAIYKEF